MKSILKLCVLFFCLTNCEAQKPNQSLSQKMDSYMEALEEDGFHGSVLVAHKGEVMLSKGYGFSDKENQIKNSKSTVFDIGSITKQFTAVGILKLEEQQKLSVNDKITKYFENVPEDKQSITIHHLLTHSSGLRPALGHDYHAISKQEYIQQAMNSELLFVPSATYEYSNTGYSLLAIIIEKVSGQSYEDFLYDYLWKPADMEQTGYMRPNYNRNIVAVGLRYSGPWGRPNEKWEDEVSWHLKGNGGVLSTVEDMYKWHKALEGTQILSIDSKKKMYTKHVEEGEGAGSYYGYGWAIFPTPRNTELIAHNGGNGIFFADFWRYPTEDIVIMMMCNSANPGYDELTSQLAGIILRPVVRPATTLRQSKDQVVNERLIEQLLDKFTNIIMQDDPNVWEEFISRYFTRDMLNLMPISNHIDMFRKMHDKLKTQNIREIVLADAGEIEIMFSESMLLISLEKTQDDKMKIAGIKME